jgi:hypothetical protein
MIAIKSDIEKQSSNDDISLYEEFYLEAKYRYLNAYYRNILKLFLCGENRILDLHPGLGDLSVYLSGEGYDQRALCLSDKFQYLVMRNAKTQGQQVTCGRINDYKFSLGDKFNGVVAKGLVSRILTVDKLKHLMLSAYNHLLDYGIFIFDFINTHEIIENEVHKISADTRITTRSSKVLIDDIQWRNWSITNRNLTVEGASIAKRYCKDIIQELAYQSGFHSVRFFDGAPSHEQLVELHDSRQDSQVLLCVARKVPYDHDTLSFAQPSTAVDKVW